MAAFLSVVTRCLAGREELFKRCYSSLAAQTDPDWEQMLMVDDVGRGFAFARELLTQANVYGRYVLILDDDDVVEAEDGVAALKAAAVGDPPAVIFRGRHADLGVLPARTWQARPAEGDIGSFDFILRADVYREFVGARGRSAYAQDHAIIKAVHDRHGPEIVWLDKIICAADRRRIGAAT